MKQIIHDAHEEGATLHLSRSENLAAPVSEGVDEVDRGSTDIPVSRGEGLVSETFPDHPRRDAIGSKAGPEGVPSLVGKRADAGGLAEPVPEAIEAVTREWGVVPVVASLQRQEQAATGRLLRSDLGEVLRQLGATGIAEGDTALLAALAVANPDDPQPPGRDEVIDRQADEFGSTQARLDGEEHQEAIPGADAGSNQTSLFVATENLGGMLGLTDSSDGEGSRIGEPSSPIAEPKEHTPGAPPVIDARRLEATSKELGLEHLDAGSGDIPRALDPMTPAEGDGPLPTEEPAVGFEGGGTEAVPLALVKEGVHSHIPSDLRTRHRGPQRYSNEDVFTGTFNSPPEHDIRTLQHEQGERGAPRRIRTPDLLIRSQTDKTEIGKDARGVRASNRPRAPLPTGICDVCQNFGIIHQDHDHSTGFIRGPLCVSCNHGIARFKDDPDRLQAAADYLRRLSTTEGYVEWRRQRHALAEKRRTAAQGRVERRAERYREKYAEDPEYRAKKNAENADYRKRAGISS